MLKSTFLLLSLSLLCPLETLAQTYKVINNCPSAIEHYVGQENKGPLSRGDSATYTQENSGGGFFYASTHGGIVDGKVYAARAGFYFVPQFWYYYIVRDPNPNTFNMGISIKPNQPENNGFCRTALCEQGDCVNAFTTPPRFRGTPPQNAPAQPPPINECKVDPATAQFDITFCPSGAWPPEVGTPIYHDYDRRKCVDVRAANFANGTPVQIYDCNNTPAQKWVIYPYNGGTKVRVANTNFCLDVGNTPGDGTQMKIWQCYDNLPAQEWRMNDTNRIYTLGNRPGLCLDLPEGDETNGRVLQTWTCGGPENSNQAWSVVA